MTVSMIVLLVCSGSSDTVSVNKHYSNCMSEYFSYLEEDFYSDMLNIEEYFLNNEILHGNTKNAYTEALVKYGDTYSGDDSLSLGLTQNGLITSTFNVAWFALCTICSEYSPGDTNTYLADYQTALRSFTIYDTNDEMLLDLMNKSDFNDAIFRMNFLYVFLNGVLEKEGYLESATSQEFIDQAKESEEND